jgi:chorismate synthase
MASNALGNLFRITTWGESHGRAVGVVIDGCPAGIVLSEALVNQALHYRAPGRNQYTSPRQERDQAEIYSGVFEGKTTGAPLSIIIPNQDVDSSKYEPVKHLLRPGHANATYMTKYGIYDYRGGGRASARETVCRVAAGAVAKAILQTMSIQTGAYLVSVGEVTASVVETELTLLNQTTYASPVFCPDPVASLQMMACIDAAKEKGDSLGGRVQFIATGLPMGLGDPVYEKLEANLAKAMLSLPASKGFEIGDGFRASQMFGSVHNDPFVVSESRVYTATNHAGGTLGGISTGMPLLGRVAFKPTSSIQIPQETLTITGDPATLQLPVGSRHDPCVAIRAVPVVDAMLALVLVDAVLMNRCAVW